MNATHIGNTFMLVQCSTPVVELSFPSLLSLPGLVHRNPLERVNIRATDNHCGVEVTGRVSVRG